MCRALLLLALTVILSLFKACVERYYPGEDQLKTGTLVINAHLTSLAGEQVIEISRSAGLTYPSFDPVSGCLAEVIREDGELRIFSESEPGYYMAFLDESFLKTGTSYMLHVSTPDGKEYESGFTKLRPVPAIDSLYYEVEHNSYASESDSTSGVHFFLDFTYDDEEYEYIRWDLTETYEIHNREDLNYYILDLDHWVKLMPDTSIYLVCYITNKLISIYSMSLSYLNIGHYIKKSLSFVPNNKLEQKLQHKYSLLVKQYSLGEEAFNYWNELKKNSQEQGSLFDRQPALLKSNIHNVNDETEVVLGFFSMAGMVEKRVFAIEPEGLDLSPYEDYCYAEPAMGTPVEFKVGRPYPIDPAPMYFATPLLSPDLPLVVVNYRCVDCREYKNSTHIPPDFW